MTTPVAPSPGSSRSAESVLEDAVRRGVVPGGIVARGRDPRPVPVGVHGIRGADGADGAPWRGDEIVRIQSMSKAILAVAALRLVEHGALGLDSPVAPWLPELATPRVLRRPDAPLTDTVATDAPLTLRHLLTCTSGYGMALTPSPLQDAMREAGLEAGALPWPMDADVFVGALAALPLVGRPGARWRYHHSFSLLGVLISRVTGTSTGEHLRTDLLDPLGMVDTAHRVPTGQEHRLPPALGEEDGALVEREPAGGGPLTGPAPHDVSHEELVSTAADYLRFLTALRDGALLTPAHLALMTTDQVPATAKDPDGFFPGFWETTGWGMGVCTVTAGAHRGRWGWSGGYGTDVFVDPDGSVGLLLTQLEMGERIGPLLEAFQKS